jgi:hypothetical protein
VIYLCWSEDYGSTRDDGTPIEETDPQYAAEEFCRREDWDDPVRSYPVIVTVEPAEGDRPCRSRSTRWRVNREMVPQCNGSEVKP